jgi:hypothetical protein
LQKSIADARSGLDPDQSAVLGRLGHTLDDVVTGAVRQAFRPAFIVTAGLALLAALALLAVALGAARVVRSSIAGAGAAAALAAAGYGIAFAASNQTTVPIRDPCQDRQLPDTGGITGEIQDISLAALDRAACSFGSSREELLLALFDDRLQHRFEQEHHVNPRDVLSLGPALLGL